MSRVTEHFYGRYWFANIVFGTIVSTNLGFLIVITDP